MTHYGSVLKQVQEKALSSGRNPQEIEIVAVSKFCPATSLESVYREGCRSFGESRLQEALEKIPLLPIDSRWHFVGSLQTNKVRKAISHFQLIHSVDDLSLAEKISEASLSMGITTTVLLQVNTSGESSKHGLSAQQWEKALDQLNTLSHLKIEGLMTMAPLIEDQNIIRNCFRTLRELRDKWRPRMAEPFLFRHLSMGMSHDFLIAIEEGATLLRIGTKIFCN